MNNRVPTGRRVPTDDYLSLLKERAIQACETEVKSRIFKFVGFAAFIITVVGYALFSLFVTAAVNTRIQPIVSNLETYEALLKYYTDKSDNRLEKLDDTTSKVSKLFDRIKDSALAYEEKARKIESLADDYKEQREIEKDMIAKMEAEIQQLSLQLKQLKAESVANSDSNIDIKDIRISIPIYGEVNTPMANTIQELLTSHGYSPEIPQYVDKGLNYTSKVLVLYNKIGCKNVLDIDKHLKSIEGLQTVVVYETKDFITTDIAITFQNKDVTYPNAQTNELLDPCKPSQPE